LKKLFNTKLWWLFLLIILLAITYIASAVHYRLDLTMEKRFTISQPTKKLIHGLDDKVSIKVFLSGELPAGFKKLANSTKDLLQEFKELSKTNIQYSFTKPGEGLGDSAQAQFQDSLRRLGLNPMNVHAQVKEGEGQEQRLVYPGALISYRGRAIAIDLLQGQSSVDGINALNNAEALLEYKFARAIQKITQDSVPVVGYLAGNGEPLSYNVYGFIENTLKRDYVTRIFPIDSFPEIPSVFSAVVIVKPTVPFTDVQKVKLDQYVMHGGKIMWLVDELYAEMDSLQRAQNDFIAFDRNLNIEDLLFKYGVRINPDLLQDLNADKIPSVVGTMGGKPQMELLPWPYFPLLSNYSNHPIAKNLDYVVSQFPNSIDTVKADGINKTILLASSTNSRILSTPAKVSFQSIQNEDDLKTFDKSNVPVAVLLEGKFQSLFANRLTQPQKDAFAGPGGFANSSPDNNKMIVIADGDIALNSVTQKEGPLPLGMNMFTKYQYANKDFLSNCLEYLTDNSGILEARSKDYTLRLLDKKKIESEKAKWQIINIVLPLLLVFIFGTLYQYIRKRKYHTGE
jgi:gliding-associated putative ABC transporter substrate-binding component GldG